MIKEIKWNDHQEWLDIRSKYIGGSDAGSVIGTNPYKSAYTLWAEKTGRVPGFEGNLTTRVGSCLEDMVAHLFEEETGKKVQRKNATMVNDLYPFACANIDRRVVGEKAFLEIKTTNNFLTMKQLRGTEFPDMYYAQCVHYLAVTGYEKCYLAVLINCRELKIYELERDQVEIDALMQAEKEFWDMVLTNTAPIPDGSASTSDTITSIYPESDGSKVDLTPFARELEIIVSLEEQVKAIKKEQDEYKNKVKDYMGVAEKGSYNDYSVSFKSSSRKTFNNKKFISEHSDMNFDSYYDTTSVRAFKVTRKENKENKGE